MVASSFSMFPLIMWLGMMGLPMGVPPLPEDPQMAKIAPEQCLFYLSSAGVGTPDGKSKNQVEQMLAEPEVQRMAAEIERAVKDVLTKKMGRDGIPGLTADDAAMLGKLFLTSPKAIYLADLQIQPRGPNLRGGMIVGLGESAGKVKTILKNAIPEGPVQKSESDGAMWYRIQPAPDAPVFKFGVKDDYFLVGLGEGEVEAMLKRAAGSPPVWLKKIGQDLPIERRSMVQYINVKKLRDSFLPMAGPQGAMIAESLGLSNVTAICAVTGLDKTEFLSRSLVAIDGEPKGIFSPANGRPLTPSDVAGLPADATLAATVRLDPRQIFDLFLNLAQAIEPREKANIDQAMKQMQSALGVKIPDDLLDPFGDTISIYDSPTEGGLVLGLTGVVKVKDAAKAKATFEKLMKFTEEQQQAMEKRMAEMAKNPQPQPWRSYHKQPKVEKIEYAGKDIYFFNARHNDFLIAPAWCLTEDELIVAIFPQSIKARLARGAKFPSLATTPPMKQALAEEGVLAVGYCDTTRLFDHLYPVFLVMAQAMTSELQREGIDVNMSLLPMAQTLRSHLLPGTFTIRRTKEGIEMSERTTLPGVGLSVTMPMTAFAAVPVMRLSTPSPMMGGAQRAQSMNNMKQIGLAMHNYADAKKSFPPAYKADKDGKPLLSWRVLILQYLEEGDLYKQFHLDEPWDSEHNKTLINQMPRVYRSPASNAGAGKTNYLTVRGEKTIYSGGKGARFADIRDGTSNTIMVVEASDEKAVPWTKPDDFEYDEKDPIKGLVGLQPNGFLALFADGSVRVIASSIDATVLRALFTRNGNEAIDQAQIR